MAVLAANPPACCGVSTGRTPTTTPPPNAALKPTSCATPSQDWLQAWNAYGFSCIRVRPLMQENLLEGRQTLSWGVS